MNQAQITRKAYIARDQAAISKNKAHAAQQEGNEFKCEVYTVRAAALDLYAEHLKKKAKMKEIIKVKKNNY